MSSVTIGKAWCKPFRTLLILLYGTNTVYAADFYSAYGRSMAKEKSANLRYWRDEFDPLRLLVHRVRPTSLRWFQASTGQITLFLTNRSFHWTLPLIGDID